MVCVVVCAGARTQRKSVAATQISLHRLRNSRHAVPKLIFPFYSVVPFFLKFFFKLGSFVSPSLQSGSKELVSHCCLLSFVWISVDALERQAGRESERTGPWVWQMPSSIIPVWSPQWSGAIVCSRQTPRKSRWRSADSAGLDYSLWSAYTNMFFSTWFNLNHLSCFSFGVPWH